MLVMTQFTATDHQINCELLQVCTIAPSLSFSFWETSYIQLEHVVVVLRARRSSVKVTAHETARA